MRYLTLISSPRFRWFRCVGAVNDSAGTVLSPVSRQILASVVTAIAFAALSAAQTKLPPPASVKIDFEKNIQPLLAEKCHSCHGAEVQQAGLRLDSRQPAMRGGDYGPVIIPGNSAGSKLIRRLVDGDGGLQMPPTGPLSSDEIGLLRAWIDQGADFRIQIKDEAPPRPVDPKVTRFISTVRSTDTKAAENLIASDPEIVNAKDRTGSTPLHHAAGFGSYAMLELLLRKGADPNAANRRQSTPLFWAIHDERKVRLLIEHGAGVNAKLVDGRTLAYQAAVLGNGLPVLRLLLQKGAEPDAKTSTGMTPLMAAAGHASVETMRLLIEKGADVNAKTAAGATPLMAAAGTGSPKAVQLLIQKGADPNVTTKLNQTALAAAATTGVEQTVKLLLDAGAKADIPDHRGYTPLLYAAGSDAVPAAVVKLLLSKGALTDSKGDGETAQMLAAKRGDTEVARLLGVPAGQAVVAVPAQTGRQRSIAEAVKPALVLLEKQSYNFIRIGGCNSCHAQDLPSVAAAIARERGLPAPKAIPQLPQHMQPNSAERLMDFPALGFTSFVAGLGWDIFDLASNKVPSNHYTDTVVRNIKALQSPEGNWFSLESRRPPMNAGPYQAAALAVYALKKYGSPSENADTANAIARAAKWFEAAGPVKTQDRAFHLLGLAWSNASRKAIDAAARQLIATQRADGGWSQLPTMSSDAYATGQALYALNVAANVAANDAIFQKGMQYLLRTQAPDGSWHVRSRSIWVQPYFESGFPYGHDQWISAAGTAWATMALSLSVERTDIAPNVSGN